jgi:hypothetical protein
MQTGGDVLCDGFPISHERCCVPTEFGTSDFCFARERDSANWATAAGTYQLEAPYVAKQFFLCKHARRLGGQAVLVHGERS